MPLPARGDDVACAKACAEWVLGKIEAIESSNGFNIAPGEWRLNRELVSVGPLMDVGIYSLNACRFLTGEEPIDISA